jgi:hypothetical protein
LFFELNKEDPFCLFLSWSMGLHKVFFFLWREVLNWVLCFSFSLKICLLPTVYVIIRSWFLWWSWSPNDLFCLFVINLWLFANYSQLLAYFMCSKSLWFVILMNIFLFNYCSLLVLLLLFLTSIFSIKVWCKLSLSFGLSSDVVLGSLVFNF